MKTFKDLEDFSDLLGEDLAECKIVQGFTLQIPTGSAQLVYGYSFGTLRMHHSQVIATDLDILKEIWEKNLEERRKKILPSINWGHMVIDSVGEYAFDLDELAARLWRIKNQGGTILGHPRFGKAFPIMTKKFLSKVLDDNKKTDPFVWVRTNNSFVQKMPKEFQCDWLK